VEALPSKIECLHVYILKKTPLIWRGLSRNFEIIFSVVKLVYQSSLGSVFKYFIALIPQFLLLYLLCFVYRSFIGMNV
jgi:hypothetical protein